MFFLEILRTNLYEMQKINNGAHELRFFGTSKQPAYFNMRNDLCCSADSLGQIFNISEERFPPPKMVFPCCVKKNLSHTIYADKMFIMFHHFLMLSIIFHQFSILIPCFPARFLHTHTHTQKKEKTSQNPQDFQGTEPPEL